MPTRLVFLLRIFIPSVGSESNVFVNIHASSKRLVQVSFFQSHKLISHSSLQLKIT